ncbi:hypothetical protein F5884DRAFT_815108 [Xylogone sp. PMI_703]|nr:hypothetical protein F5884DRAFT_815108 [Xylogone sp. PMI_703]
MTTQFLSGFHAFQVAFGAYNIWLASATQSKLESYEVVSKKSSKSSEKGGEQKTTPKSGTGGFASICSMVMALTLLISQKTVFWELLVSVVCFATLFASRRHVGVFGIEKDKLKGDGAAGYIQVMEKIQDVKYNMLYLALTWAVSAVLAAFVAPRAANLQG